METNERTHTEIMNVESPEEFIGMFGIQEENIPLFREELGVEIYAHGGEITVSSKLKVGSIFTVTLPQKVYDSSPSNFEIRQWEKAGREEVFRPDFIAPKAKVLIVDDNKVNRQVAQELLKLFGIEAALAESGQEAIDKVTKNLVSYDLIFMDHMMPYMDGVEATRKIRLLNSNYARQVPIIALTANAIKGVEQQFLDSGMNDYLPKPIRIEMLGEILKRWIPKEKMFAPGTTMEEIEAREAAKPWISLSEEQKLARLDGIDTQTGIKNCAGNVNAYFELLRTYSGSNLATLLQQFYEAEDLENYAITAHSIKGASLSVGATDVADMAYSLERAGKRGDITYIWDHHEDLMEEYTKITGMLRKNFTGI